MKEYDRLEGVMTLKARKKDFSPRLRGVRRGLTLIEALVALALLAIVGVGTLQVFSKTSAVVRSSSVRVDGSALATEQIEIIHNLPYADVGIAGSIPTGVIQRTQTLTRDNKQFLVTTTIRNIDDPFDGTIGGTPNDLSPADYKLVEVNVACQNCPNPGRPTTITTTVAPKNLETASANGALFVRVFDASGEPIPNANVHVENNAVNPAVIIDEETNASGVLQLVDVPPATDAYEITVAKNGYSSESTYPPGAPGNPNPTKPHASVLLQQVTQISFAIDRVSSIAVKTASELCVPVGNINFDLSGSKLIGMTPDVKKYNQSFVTDGSGQRAISNLEWDTYNIDFTDTAYDLQGAIPALSLPLNPDTNMEVDLTVRLKNPQTLLVAVKDGATQLPVSEATVTMERTGFSQSLVTGRGYLRQTDWAGGSGQNDFTDATKYLSDDGNIDVTTQAGAITLKSTFDVYAPSGTLTSSIFDTGLPSNFHNIVWEPQSQPPETGPDSVRFQIAANSDNSTWNFVGPDGTDASFFTLADTNINAAQNNNRYFRYKLFLSTADPTITPTISDIAFTFTSDCVPPGQALFDGIANGTYTLTVSKTGYQTSVEDVDVTLPWEQHDVLLIPE